MTNATDTRTAVVKDHATLLREAWTRYWVINPGPLDQLRDAGYEVNIKISQILRGISDKKVSTSSIATIDAFTDAMKELMDEEISAPAEMDIETALRLFSTIESRFLREGVEHIHHWDGTSYDRAVVLKDDLRSLMEALAVIRKAAVEATA